MEAEDELEVLERVEISDDEGDDYKYEGVEEDLGFDEDEDEDEDITNALANLKGGATQKSETAAMDSSAGYRSITQVSGTAMRSAGRPTAAARRGRERERERERPMPLPLCFPTTSSGSQPTRPPSRSGRR